MAEDSILKSTRVSLGVGADETAFDTEILMHLNSAIATLHQIGLEPKETGLYVEGVEATWTQLIGPSAEQGELAAVKTYIHLRVKMLFDPPEVGFVLTAMKEQIRELEWRLNVTVDTPDPTVTPTDGVVYVDIFDGQPVNYTN